MISRRHFISGTLSALLFRPRLAFSSGADERQAIAANIERLLQTLESIGQPIERGDQARIAQAATLADKAESIHVMQNTLSKYVLARVAVNPESRVSVLRGGAPPILEEGGWRAFCIEVLNQGEITSRLNVVSPQAQPMYAYSPGSAMTPAGLTPSGASDPLQTITAADVEGRWMSMDVYHKSPMGETLDGLSLEYALVLLYSRDRGKRTAEFQFDAGPDTRDLGSRSTLRFVFSCIPANSILLHIADDDGRPTTARLLIADQSGRVYPEQARRRAPDLAFQKQIYRSNGQNISLPSGQFTLEYGRGPEYLTLRRNLEINPDHPIESIDLRLQRWVNPGSFGWYSGDHHIHAAGCAHYTTPSEGIRPEDIVYQVRGEGLAVGDVLTWGPSWYFQKEFFGKSINSVSAPDSILKYDVEISGFPSSHCGHLCLLNLQQQDFPGTTVIEQWPSWNLPILRWAKAQGATVGYAHSGHGLTVDSQLLPNYLIPAFDDNGANEFLMDAVHGAVDFISVVDTPPLAELNIWYHALNCGFRTRIAGETDFPCLFERVGVGRTYVHLLKAPTGEQGYREWIRGLAEGRSYVSEGKSHLFDFEVDGFGVGQGLSELRYGRGKQVTLTARVAGLCAQTVEGAGSQPATEKLYWDIELARKSASREVSVEIVVNGAVVRAVTFAADGQLQNLLTEIDIDRSSWIALRILPSAHTNPIFVIINDQPIFASTRSAQWCFESVEAAWEKMSKHIRPQEMAEAQSACDHARKVFENMHRGS